MNENQTLAIVVIAGGILLFVFKDAPTKIPEPAPEPMEQEYDQQIDQMNQKMQVLYNQINQQFIQKRAEPGDQRQTQQFDDLMKQVRKEREKADQLKDRLHEQNIVNAKLEISADFQQKISQFSQQYYKERAELAQNIANERVQHQKDLAAAASQPATAPGAIQDSFDQEMTPTPSPQPPQVTNIQNNFIQHVGADDLRRKRPSPEGVDVEHGKRAKTAMINAPDKNVQLALPAPVLPDSAEGGFVQGEPNSHVVIPPAVVNQPRKPLVISLRRPAPPPFETPGKTGPKSVVRSHEVVEQNILAEGRKRSGSRSVDYREDEITLPKPAKVTAINESFNQEGVPQAMQSDPQLEGTVKQFAQEFQRFVSQNPDANSTNKARFKQIKEGLQTEGKFLEFYQARGAIRRKEKTDKFLFLDTKAFKDWTKLNDSLSKMYGDWKKASADRKSRKAREKPTRGAHSVNPQPAKRPKPGKGGKGTGGLL